ncbi:MAG: helix-turn-helix transcriptional regulator [Candidatus Sericytochromatia bacterium]
MDKQEFLKIISYKLRFIRASKGYSQDKLALESNIDRTHISRIERGQANPTAFQLIKIALVLNIEAGELFPSINDIQKPYNTDLN